MARAPPAEIYVDSDQDDTDSGVDGDVKDAGEGEEAPEPKKQRKGGLQGWVDRCQEVVAEDPSLTIRCRQFIRKRILSANAERRRPDSAEWDEEPLPTLQDLRDLAPM